METYLPLLSVSVEHSYFSDGEWKGLEFVPTQSTIKVIEGADILVKKSNNGIDVFYNTKRADALSLYAADTEGELRFSFKVFSRDRTFANYTALAERKGDTILVFDNRESVGGVKGENVNLCKDDFVSDKDYREMDAFIADGILSEKDRRLPPDFLVEIYIEPQKNELSAKTSVWTPLNGYVKFNTRRSFWRYFLLGSMNRSDPSIVDLDNRVEFESCGEVVLTGNKYARLFRSKEAIPLLEKSSYRFQLREKSEGGNRVLIKRLPVASESRLGMDVINGKSEIVLETYINC